MDGGEFAANSPFTVEDGPDRERVTSAEDQTYQDGADSNTWTGTADYPDCAARPLPRRSP